MRQAELDSDEQARFLVSAPNVCFEFHLLRMYSGISTTHRIVTSCQAYNHAVSLASHGRV